MCEAVKSTTINGPWIVPNVIVHQCPRKSAWWVQNRIYGNLTVCTQHLPSTLKRLGGSVGERNDTVVKRRWTVGDRTVWV